MAAELPQSSQAPYYRSRLRDTDSFLQSWELVDFLSNAASKVTSRPSGQLIGVGTDPDLVAVWGAGC